MAAAQQHGAAHLLGVIAHVFEELGDGDQVRGHMHPVPGPDDGVAVGNKGIVIPLDDAIQNPGNARGQRPDGRVHDGVALHGLEFHHLHPPMGKGLNVGGKGKAQEPGNFHGRGPLRIDHQVDAHAVLQERDALGVFRVADARDGVFGAQLLGRQTAYHVGLVVGGDRDQDIRLVRARLQQGAHVGPVALDAHDVQGFGGLVQGLLVAVHQRYVVIFFGKVFCQRIANLAVADNDDVHLRDSPVLSFTLLRAVPGLP